MATVIDALVVTLGLDASKFTTGMQEADAAMKRTSANSDKLSKDMEVAAKHIAEGFNSVRNQLLGLFAAFTAGRGLKEMVVDLNKGDAAIGRMAKSLGLSTPALATWKNALERAGGTSDDALTSFQNLSEEIAKFQSGERSAGPWMNVFARAGISLVDTKTGELKSVQQDFIELSDWLHKLSPQMAQQQGGQAGATPGFSRFLSQGRAAVEGQLAQVRADGVPNEKDASWSQKLQGDTTRLRQQFDNVVRTIKTELSPELDKVATKLSDWVNKHAPAFEKNVVDAIERFAKWLMSVDWDAVGAGITTFASKVDSVAQSLGGWLATSELLFALWVGAKFAAVLANISTMGVGIATASGNLGLFRAGFIGLLADQALKAIDPNDDAGTWIDKNVPGAAAIDDWAARHFGVGRTFEQQGAAAGPTSEQQKQSGLGAMDYFISKGWTPQQAAGIVGNLQQESGFNPQAKNGGHIGIAQWSEGRQAAIAMHFNKPVSDMNTQEQMEVVNWELTQGRYKSVGDALRSMKTSEQSAAVIDHGYEVPVGKDGDWSSEDARRGSNANNWLREFDQRKYTPPPIPSAGVRWGNTSHVDQSSKAETHIGNLVINTRATDAAGIARDARSAVANTFNSLFANRSLA